MKNVVLLPEIKFADFKSADIYATNANSDDPAKVLESRSTSKVVEHQPQITKHALPSETRRPADERLAADKLGTELAPGATIWELYQEEANEFDNELVDGRNQNLDTMLLFAGLFSAIVTGFVLESRNKLQQDPAEASLFLLLQIARSQQRLEEGTTQPISSTISIPEYETPTSARWINGLWFMSLNLSLSSAFIAMLAKEWLAAFVASRPHSPYMHARIHQKRIRGINKWHALHIIDLLPSLMYIALALFSAGLVIDLWGFDPAIAASMLVVVGVTLLFYMSTLVLASISRFCPFVTQLSKYAQALLSPHLSSNTPTDYVASGSEKAEATSLEEFQALDWLAKNAQDPTVSDCAYQALAGIKPRNSPNDTPRPSDSNPTVPIDHDIKCLTRVHQQAAGMFQELCTRIPQILFSTSDRLSDSQEYAISRYTFALPRLVEFLENDAAPFANEKQKYWVDWSTRETPTQIAFDIIDSAWNDAKPCFTADTYALLTAAELNLVRFAAPDISIKLDEAVPMLAEVTRSPPGIIPRNAHVVTHNWSAIDMRANTASGVSLFDLRARFSRALFRVAVQLRCHGEGCTAIRADILVHLLDSMTLAFSCPLLNPSAPVSTHQRQRQDDDALPIFLMGIADVGIQCSLTACQMDDVDGIITDLLRVICSTTLAEAPELMRSASRALCIAAPVLLRQWLNTILDSGDCSREEGIRINEALHDSPMLWWEAPADSSDNRLGVCTLRQLLEIAFIASAFSEHRGIGHLSGRALHALCRLGRHGSGRDWGTQIAALCAPLVTKLISATSATQNLQSLKYLIKWLLSMDLIGTATLIQCSRSSEIHDLARETDPYPVFFSIWAQNEGLDFEMRNLVRKIAEGPMDDAIEYLWSVQGLSILSEIGNHSDYAPILAELLACMIQNSLNTSEIHYWDNPSILPSFLSVLDRVLDHTPNLAHQYPVIPRTITSVAETVLAWAKESNEPAKLREDATIAGIHKLLKTKAVETLPEQSQLLMAYDSIDKTES